MNNSITTKEFLDLLKDTNYVTRSIYPSRGTLELPEVLRNHEGRNFRRASWDSTTPSWFVEDGKLRFKNLGGSFLVSLSLDSLEATDWIFDDEEEKLITAQEFLRDLASRFEEVCGDSPCDQTSASYRLRCVADYVDRLVDHVTDEEKSHGITGGPTYP